ncbi:hypothetical protein EXU85_30810 [Spirosoma sp. KCTC 42546]|uniref:hypothetical protein n=1 Tax=Spirosoma sp. KCTC 42546 TaxID=2520506 RepID=UPI001158DB5D|nr:hypothetical protein [Spirosoma sp. KCTC 42546]QDK82763.1 hypothetical protein EXU85_30810 [Spirosoma sp. KCTC 42546]
MNQGTLFQVMVFGALYAVGFFIVYLVGRRKSPRNAIQYSVGSWVGLMAVVLVGDGPSSCVLFVILFLVSFIVFRKKADISLQAFFTANHIYKAATAPEQVSTLLGSQYYSCADVKMTVQTGEEICFNWWQGMTSSTGMSGNAHVTTFTYYLAVSFAPNTISEQFKRVAREKIDTSGFTFRQKFNRFFVLDTVTPIRIAETENGSFVIIWQTYHDVERFRYYIDWLKANLSGTKKLEPVEMPIEREPVPILLPETPSLPVIPSSRQHHEQALGRVPKIYVHSAR